MDIPWSWILIIAGAVALLANFGMLKLNKEYHKWLVIILAILAIAVGFGMLVIQPASLNF